MPDRAEDFDEQPQASPAFLHLHGRKLSGSGRAVRPGKSGIFPTTRRPVRRRPHLKRAPSPHPAGAQPQVQRPGIETALPFGGNNHRAAAVAVLLGCTTGMVITGLTMRFQGVFEAPESHPGVFGGTVVGVALLTLAVGVCVPRRFAMWVYTLAWRRFVARGTPPESSAVLLGTPATDAPMYWVVLAVIALAAGVFTALLPLNVRIASAAYEWMRAHFLWSAASLSILQAAAVLAVGLLPLTAQGLAASCVHRLSCPRDRWDPKATGWLVTGAAGGALISCLTARETGRADLTLLAAALPVLLTVLLSAASGPSSSDTAKGAAEPVWNPLPTWRDRWPVLLRASIVAVGGSGAFATCLWARHLEEFGAEAGAVIAALLSAMGLGLLAGCRVRRGALRTIGGFGFICAMAGAIVAASTLGLSDPEAGFPGVVLLPACISLFAVGLATSYGWQALLNRVASRSFAGAAILTQLLVCAALAVWIGVPAIRRYTEVPATLVIVALFLLALGGMLIIHEPRYSPRTRRARLGTVFASITVMILLAWSTPRWWERRSTSRPDALEPEPEVHAHYGKTPSSTPRHAADP